MRRLPIGAAALYEVALAERHRGLGQSGVNDRVGQVVILNRLEMHQVGIEAIEVRDRDGARGSRRRGSPPSRSRPRP